MGSSFHLAISDRPRKPATEINIGSCEVGIQFTHQLTRTDSLDSLVQTHSTHSYRITRTDSLVPTYSYRLTRRPTDSLVPSHSYCITRNDYWGDVAKGFSGVKPPLIGLRKNFLCRTVLFSVILSILHENVFQLHKST